MEILPLGLRSALEAGECVLYIGAGIGHYMKAGERDIPAGNELALELCEHFKLGIEAEDLAKVARLVELRKSRTDLEAEVSPRTSR